MIKTGIIGYGKMGKIRAKTALETTRAKICAVYEPARDSADVDLPWVETTAEVLQHAEIQAVFICTPNNLNKPLTIAALQAGKHVFCEKPPAFTARDIEEIRDAEAASGRKLMYGFNHRHHGSMQRAKHEVESGNYGRLLWMRGRYGKSVDLNFTKTWRARQELAGGGILLDQGIHMLDLFLFFAEEFDVVQALVSNLYWKLDIEDNVFAQFLNTKTGIAASLHSTMTQWRHLFSLEIFLEKGHIVINGLKTPSGTYGDEVLTLEHNSSKPPEVRWDETVRITYNADTSWRSEVDSFFDAIEHDRPVMAGNSADALKLMRLIDQIYTQGRWQTINPNPNFTSLSFSAPPPEEPVIRRVAKRKNHELFQRMDSNT
jgi:predicted dehydrogenase